jgi:hypothetical protein
VNGLMIAFAFAMPYHILRTATAAGLRVHVLGSGPSRGLRASRHCASYRKSRLEWRGPHDHAAILDEIGDIVRRRGIDIVFPGDDVATRLLAAIRDRLPVRSTPLPDLATFDLLNDKWRFSCFALDHGVRVPRGWHYEQVDEVRRDLLSGARALPVTVKPPNWSGGRGVIHIRDSGEIAQLDTVDYRPILVQQHIIGETIGISAICRDGKVVAHATQRRDERRFQLFANPDLVGNVERLVAASRLSGPANFDAVLEKKSGLAYIVECNPRFWYTIYMSMIVGLNFFDAALGDDPAGDDPQPATLAHGQICLSAKATITRPWQATRQDWHYIAYHFGDPLLYLAERQKLFNDAEVAVEGTQAQAPQPPSPRGRIALSRALGGKIAKQP